MKKNNSNINNQDDDLTQNNEINGNFPSQDDGIPKSFNNKNEQYIIDSDIVDIDDILEHEPVNVKQSKRRRGPDSIIKALTSLKIITWMSLIFTLIIIQIAKPKSGGFFKTKYGSNISNHWNYDLLAISLVLMLLGIALSIFGLYINSKRMRRKNDSISKILLFTGVIFLISLILLLINFFNNY